MNKCGKSFLPKCEYFTTGGCISPFNCPYKIEHESITTSTSTPLNSNVIYTDETYKDKELSRLTAEVAELRARLEKAIELSVKVGDTVYCIRNCGTVGYRIEENTVSEIVFEYNNRMRIRTSYGLFGYENWIFGVDCFADNAEAKVRLKELLGGEERK